MNPISVSFIALVAFSLSDFSSAQENRQQSDHLFFQPSIHYVDEEETSNAGTGFFIKGPGQKLFGLTSAHFFDFSKSVEKVDWLGLKDPDERKAVVSFTSTFGKPGSPGTDKPTMDYRTDFMVFPFEGETEPDCLALSIDGRDDIDKSEGVWFPLRDASSKNGWRKVGMKIYAVEPGVIGAIPAEEITTPGISGSPLLATKGNGVLGLLVGAVGLKSGETLFLFAPVSGLLEQLKSEPENVVLKKFDFKAVAFEQLKKAIVNSVWEGRTPFGNPVTVKFTEKEMSWDSVKDWTDEYNPSHEKNTVVAQWAEMGSEVSFSFSDDFDECEIVVAIRPDPVKLKRVK